jgi:mannose/fructose/N-acetylgalactosamine-specific phosphotransferase system component IID
MQYGIGTGLVVLLITLVMTWLIGVRRREPVWLLLIALMVGSVNFIYQSVSIME